MIYLQLLLLVIGVALLVVGYRRNERKLMLVAAIVLFLAGSGAQLVTGFVEGLHQGIAGWAK
ncbi:hypothetical protein AB7849_02790 [Rhodanobacter sp. 115]|uniref:hypothetical protein n=1 Tax=Rhodanobacter sp. FW021-MT20 TaxID=1162282 RepID=UPI000260CDE6|nr:hypothetical protein [Rhodanobacter sp. 115]EIL98381.1 hypothetical protein UU5_03787 [Rhodanobacter sp. 115]